MHRHLRILIGVALTLPLAGPVRGGDWIFAPSTFSHEPQTGHRISQYALKPPVFAPQPADFQQSGYHHYRSSIQAGGSADNLHVVEQWGQPVRPYGEWRFPYRPYSVPYPAWGPPVPNVYAPSVLSTGNYGRGDYGRGDYGRGDYGRGDYAGGRPARVPPGREWTGDGPRADAYSDWGPRPWHEGFYPKYDQGEQSASFFYQRGLNPKHRPPVRRERPRDHAPRPEPR